MKKLIILIILSTTLFSCSLIHKKEAPKTQLEIRAMEIREYDSKSIKTVIKALMNVYLDQNYMIEEAVGNLGVIYAQRSKTLRTRNRTADFVTSVLFQPKKKKKRNGRIVTTKEKEERYAAIEIVSSSAHVTKFGNKYRVRVNFNIKTLDQFGKVYSFVNVEDPEKFHRDFFNALGKSIFIENEGI